MNWTGKRLPEMKLFAHGWIKYSKNEDLDLMFQISIFSNDGYTYTKGQKFPVPSENFIKDISACNNIDDLMNVLDQHINIKVVQQ